MSQSSHSAQALHQAAPGQTSLHQAMQAAWQHQEPPPATSREALGRVQETLRLSLSAFDEEQLVSAQTALEDTLLQILVAMHSLSMNPDQALQRALARLAQHGGERAFHIFDDRMEIRVQGDVRGGWPLTSQADYDAALALARELDCQVIHEEASQLGIFKRI